MRCSPENGIAAEDELILRRVQFADGRTRAFVNDQPVSVQVMKQLGGALVEIHGQHDDRALVDAATHRRLLDAYGGLEDDAAKLALLWEARREAEAAVEDHRAEVERARREADWLRHAVDELGKLAPQPGEETALAERRSAMMQVEKVAEDLREAHEVVGGKKSPVSAIAGALRRLERRQPQAPALIEPVVKSLDTALNGLEEARAHLEAALRAADYDPDELERGEERLFALRAAARKYNVPVDNLAALAEQYRGDIALIDAGEEKLKALEATARAAEAAYAQGRRGAVEGAHQGGGRARQGGEWRTQAAQARARASFMTRDRERRRARRRRTASTGSSSGCRPIRARGRGR